MAKKQRVSVKKWRRLQLLGVALACGVAVSAAMLALDLLRGEPITQRRLEIAAVIVALFTGIFGFSLWLGSLVERRRARRSVNPSSVQRALTSGRPPVDADRDEWVPKLQGMIRSGRWELLFSTGVFGAMSVLGVSLIVSGEERLAYSATLTVGFMAMVVGAPIHHRRRRKKIERLIEAFEVRAADDDVRTPSSPENRP